MASKDKTKNRVSARSVGNRVEMATRLAILLTEQGREHNPEARNAKVDQQIQQLNSVFKEQIAKGEKLAAMLQEKGADRAAQQRGELEKTVKEIDKQLDGMLEASQMLDEKYHFKNLIENERAKREARKKRRKVVKKTIGPNI